MTAHSNLPGMLKDLIEAADVQINLYKLAIAKMAHTSTKPTSLNLQLARLITWKRKAQAEQTNRVYTEGVRLIAESHQTYTEVVYPQGYAGYEVWSPKYRAQQIRR